MSTPQPSSDLDFQATLQILTEQFFADLGLQGLSGEEKGKRMAEIQEIIMGKVLLSLEDGLTQEQKEEWVTCETDEQMNAFFNKHQIPILDIIQEETEAYREELVQAMAYMQGKMEEGEK